MNHYFDIDLSVNHGVDEAKMIYFFENTKNPTFEDCRNYFSCWHEDHMIQIFNSLKMQGVNYDIKS